MLNACAEAHAFAPLRFAHAVEMWYFGGFASKSPTVKDESFGLVSVLRLKVLRLSVLSRSRTKFWNLSRLGLVSDENLNLLNLSIFGFILNCFHNFWPTKSFFLKKLINFSPLYSIFPKLLAQLSPSLSLFLLKIGQFLAFILNFSTIFDLKNPFSFFFSSAQLVFWAW